MNFILDFIAERYASGSVIDWLMLVSLFALPVLVPVVVGSFIPPIIRARRQERFDGAVPAVLESEPAEAAPESRSPFAPSKYGRFPAGITSFRAQDGE